MAGWIDFLIFLASVGGVVVVGPYLSAWPRPGFPWKTRAYTVSHARTQPEENLMRRIFVSIALVGAACCFFAEQASAWTCMAVGSDGRTATGSAILIERARGIALRRCESPQPWRLHDPVVPIGDVIE